MADTDLEKGSDDKWAEPACASEKPLLEEPEETCDTSQTPSSPRSLRELLSTLHNMVRRYFSQFLTPKNVAKAASVVLVAFFFAVLLGLIIDDRARIAALEKSLNTTHKIGTGDEDDTILQQEFERLENDTKLLNETLRASEEHTVYLEKRVARLERAAETTDAKLEGFAEILANVSSKCSQLETNLKQSTCPCIKKPSFSQKN